MSLQSTSEAQALRAESADDLQAVDDRQQDLGATRTREGPWAALALGFAQSEGFVARAPERRPVKPPIAGLGDTPEERERRAFPRPAKAELEERLVSFNSKVEPARDARDIHRELVEEAEKSALELAVLSKLKAWEMSADAYTLEEVMQIVRWVEPLLEKKPEPVPLWRQLWQRLRQAPRNQQLIAAGIAAFLLLIFLIFLSATTGVAIESSKIVAMRPPGLITIQAQNGGRLPAGVGTAVNQKLLGDFPSLPLQDLRRAQVVTLRVNNEFHLYRVATIASQLGQVQILAQDGTLLTLQAGEQRVWRPWTLSQSIADQGPTLPTGVLRVVVAEA